MNSAGPKELRARALSKCPSALLLSPFPSPLYTLVTYIDPNITTNQTTPQLDKLTDVRVGWTVPFT